MSLLAAIYHCKFIIGGNIVKQTYFLSVFVCLSLFLVALAAIIKCECGNAGKHFTDMPFETKHNLMPCSAEGKGIAGVKKKSICDLAQVIFISESVKHFCHAN